jgi:ferritin-like metal-binding protein YciE
MTDFNSLQDVLAEQLGDLRSAEQQLVQALPKLAGAAGSDDLRQTFENHLEETRGHAKRLDQIISDVTFEVPDEHCKGMEGLIEEGDSVVEAGGDASAKDAALIAAAQRVEHYEIAGYGTARELARQLDLEDVADLLSETLDEESAANEKLTKLATGSGSLKSINKAAAS